jgi:hypothetical protein
MLNLMAVSALGRLTVPPRQVISQSLVYAFVEQKPHLGFGGQKLAGFFEGGDGHLAPHRGESFQNGLEGFSGFEVVLSAFPKTTVLEVLRVAKVLLGAKAQNEVR